MVRTEPTLNRWLLRNKLLHLRHDPDQAQGNNVTIVSFGKGAEMLAVSPICGSDDVRLRRYSCGYPRERACLRWSTAAPAVAVGRFPNILFWHSANLPQ